MRFRIFAFTILVCALSVPVHGQGVRIRHRQLTATVVQNPPTTPDQPSPADATTIQTISPVLTCIAFGDAQGGALSYTVQFGTNTPPTNIANGTSLGGSCAYTPATLNYDTLYYWRITATNTNGSTVSAIWSFTTGPDPTPPVDPDVTCLSTTASPTGHQPMSWTSCRQDTWDHMEADFLAVCPGVAASFGACSATPTTMGGKIFKHIREVALVIAAGSCANGACYGDIGQYAAWMYQATGDAAWAARSYTILDAFFDVQVDARPYQAAPYQAYHQLILNNVRETALRAVRIADWIGPGLSAPEVARLKDGNAQFIGGALHHANSTNVGADSDELVGEYCATVMHYLANPTYQPAIDNYNWSTIGGLTPTVTAANFVQGIGATMRNAVQFYIDLAAGGEWIEASQYNWHTTVLVMECQDAIKTMTGVDYFPEVTAWLQEAAVVPLYNISPNLSTPITWGDDEYSGVLRKFSIAAHLITLSGLLQGTTPGQKLFDLYSEMVDLYGLYGYGSMQILSNSGMGYIFFNPYETPVEWRTGTSLSVSGMRTTYRKSHATSTTASEFLAFYGGPTKFRTSNNQSTYVQHQGTEFGDWRLWRNGNWAVTHPLDYSGPQVYSGDGLNGPMMFGYAAMKGYNGAFATVHGTLYSYVTGTTGGAQHLLPFYQPPPIFANEWTREMIYVPGTTDTVIIYDRANIISPFPDTSPTSRYSPAVQANLHRYDAKGSKIIVQHMETLPVLSGSAFTWTTAGSETGTLTVAYPIVFGSTIYNETSNPDGWTLWSKIPTPLKKFHVKVYPTDSVLFNTFLTVTQIGTAGVVTATEDSGKTQCAHVTRPTQADVLACFNSEAGASLNPIAYSTSHPTDLAVVRYRETGYTISWTASSAASTLVLLQDLNPANSWTINVDGGGAVAINGATLTTNKGHYTTTISGAGSHSIAIVGS